MGNSQFASGKKSIGFCDRCGRKVPYKELTPQVVNQIVTDIRVCKPCLDKDHPQWRIGRVRITDPQALRNTRPDPNLVLSRDIQWGWNPVGFNNTDRLFESTPTPDNLLATGEIGTVTVEITTPGPTPGAPVITTCSPPVSSSAGGGTAYLIGSGMTGVTAVDFGGAAGTSINVVDDTVVTVVIPAHDVGAVSVSATNPSGTGTWSGTFTYY